MAHDETSSRLRNSRRGGHIRGGSRHRQIWLSGGIRRSKGRTAHPRRTRRQARFEGPLLEGQREGAGGEGEAHVHRSRSERGVESKLLVPPARLGHQHSFYAFSCSRRGWPGGATWVRLASSTLTGRHRLSARAVTYTHTICDDPRWGHTRPDTNSCVVTVVT